MKTMKINGIHMNDRYTPVNSFDLEDAIMNAWRTSEDIKSLYKSSEYMDEDQMMNALLGLEIFAEMRFNDLWNTFEQCANNGVFNDKARRGDEIAKALDEATQGFCQEKL
jgi:hypothetical protein